MVVPSAPVLLTEYAGLADPVPDLRAAVVAAVSWLVDGADGVGVLTGDATDNTGRGVADAYPTRLARQLLADAGHTADTVAPGDADAVLVVADGSARRSEKAPGHLDERSSAFDAEVGRALREGDLAALRGVDGDLGAELLAAGVPALRELASLVGEVVEATVDHDDDPYGVQYWVVRWECTS